MKKLLALVLALVMTLSLCITSNAAFAGEEYDYDEAVEVMAAVGVFQGDENGKFNGKTELTREQAAKLIAYLDLGEKVAEALPAVKVFNDVEATRWSSKYIAYCADAGYLAGVGNGNFDPAGKLTGYAFGKMLLCALGYDAKIEQFTGSNWSITVAKLMQANDIAKGVSGSASAVLTREQAAQYCLNTLQADMVGYLDRGTQITINGAVIATGASKADPEAAVDEGTLMAHLYGEDLEKDDVAAFDAFERPAVTWTYEDDPVGTYAETADYTFVVDEETTLEDLLKDEKLDKKVDAGEHAEDEYAAGDIVELFVDDGEVEYAVAYNYVPYTIDDVTELDDGNAADKDAVKAGAVYELDFGEFTAYDIQIADFNAKTYIEDAVVLFPVLVVEDAPVVDEEAVEIGDDDGDLYVGTVIAESITGKVTAIGADYVKVNGEKKIVSGAASDAALGLAAADKGTFYLDPNGFIVDFVADEDAQAVIGDVLVAVEVYPDTTTKYGKETTITYVQAVALDGTVKELPVGKSVEGVEVEFDDETDATGLEAGVVFTAKEVKKGDAKGLYAVTVYDGEINDDYSWKEINLTGLEADDNKVDGVRLNSKTTYINVEDSLDDIDVTVKVGGVTVKEAPPELALVIYTEESGNEIAAYIVMLDAELKDSTKSDEVVYFSAALAEDTAENYAAGEDEDIAAVSFDVYTLKGAKKTISMTDDDYEALGEGFYTITEVDDDGLATLDNTDVDATVAEGEVTDTGAVEAEFDSAFGTLLTAGELEDLETKDATIVDIHDQDDEDQYGKTVKTLAAMTKLADNYTITLNIYADEDDGAVIIFVTSVAVAELG